MAKSGFVKTMDNLSWIVKLILCIPMLNIVWGIYRIVKGVTENKGLVLIAGILWIIPGSAICWLVDLITTIVSGRPTIFA